MRTAEDGLTFSPKVYIALQIGDAFFGLQEQGGAIRNPMHGTTYLHVSIAYMTPEFLEYSVRTLQETADDNASDPSERRNAMPYSL